MYTHIFKSTSLCGERKREFQKKIPWKKTKISPYRMCKNNWRLLDLFAINESVWAEVPSVGGRGRPPVLKLGRVYCEEHVCAFTILWSTTTSSGASVGLPAPSMSTTFRRCSSSPMGARRQAGASHIQTGREGVHNVGHFVHLDTIDEFIEILQDVKGCE